MASHDVTAALVSHSGTVLMVRARGSGGGDDSRGGRDSRSLHVQDLLRAKWRDEIKKKGPRERIDWLRSTEGIIAHGAAAANQIAKELETKCARVARAACSASWQEEFERASTMPPGLEFGPKLRIQQKRDGRRYSVRLMLSGPPTRRWTPPQAVELEDYIDRMTPDQAAWWSMTAGESPSAVSVRRVALAKAKPVSGNW